MRNKSKKNFYLKKKKLYDHMTYNIYMLFGNNHFIKTCESHEICKKSCIKKKQRSSDCNHIEVAI